MSLLVVKVGVAHFGAISLLTLGDLRFTLISGY